MSLDQRAIQDLLESAAQRRQVPGASLAVFADGQLIEAATGVLNVETGVEATTDSLFQIGSVTKPYTASLIMQLSDEGRLDIDEPVVASLPELRLADQESAERVTMRHLLSHSSGIEGDQFEDFGRGDDALERFVAGCAELGFSHPVGATMSYCNTGYVIAGRIVERLTDQTWDAALTERIVEPLGRDHTVTLPEQALRFRTAYGHVTTPGKATSLAPTWVLPRAVGPAGLICATAADMVAFGRWHLDKGRTADGRQTLSTEAAESMQDAVIDIPNPWTLGTSWGLGWILYDWDGHRVYGHDGATIGQTAWLRIVPGSNVVVGMLANGGHASDFYRDVFPVLMRELCEITMPSPLSPPDDPPEVETAAYAGTYERLGVRYELDVSGPGLAGKSTMTGPLAEIDPDPVEEITLVPVSEGVDADGVLRARRRIALPPQQRAGHSEDLGGAGGAMKGVWVAAGVALVVSAAACGSTGGGGERTDLADSATYVTAIDADPGNLHPLKTVRQTTNTVVTFAYDTLINIDPDGTVVSQLAKDWGVSDRSVTFTLNDGVTCSDGTELTAEAVADNFTWIKDPSNGSSVIGSGLPSTDYTVDYDNAAGTVTITMGAPYGFLLEGAGLVRIVCPQGLADPDSLAHATDGTGPYVLTDYAADDHVTLSVRDDYTWGPNGATTDVPGVPDQVEFRVVQNATTAVNLFLSGELSDVTPNSSDRARLEGRDAFTLETEQGPSEFFFNERDGFPTSDPDVRQALTMAMDREALMTAVTEGKGTAADGLAVIAPRPCPEDTVSGHLPDFDPEAAGDLLDQAGWTMGSDGVRAKDGEDLTVTLAYPTGEPATEAAMELVRGWWEDIGVSVEPKGQNQNAFLETLFGGSDWDASFLNVQLAYPSDFVAFASGPAPPDGQNFAAITNPTYDRLSTEAAATPTEGGGCDKWAAAEQALFEAADVVPISNNVTVTYADKVEFSPGIWTLVEPTSIRMYEQ
jgi:CubicO group peptidase (beta-lactamase class C family)/ABC-type transport system substrate-binding protein